MPLFETVAEEYDAVRPPYPAALFDALDPVVDLQVLDVGAGTGIASRQFLDRAARVIAIDNELAMLRRAVMRTAVLPAAVADGAMLPVRSGSIDLVCFAQSWHWLDAPTGVREVHRVLRPDGRFAAWWSHARADGAGWFDSYWDSVEDACPGVSRTQRDVDWSVTMTGAELFDVGKRVTVCWERQLTIDQFITEVSSYSFVAALADRARAQLLTRVRRIVRAEFDGAMGVPYETWLWIANRNR